MTLSIVRSLPEQPRSLSVVAEEGTCGCAENLRLRQAYIDRLAEFNHAAGLHRVVRRAGVAGIAFDRSWRKFQDGCVSSHEAWARYRQHVAAHGCKRV